MKREFKKGFTLIEIILVVSIIAIMAAITIPNLIRARRSANDALAQSTLRAISTAAETYSTENQGAYPADETDLTDATPKYLNESYCGTTVSGFNYICSMSMSTYTVEANPIPNLGTQKFTITAGGVLHIL